MNKNTQEGWDLKFKFAHNNFNVTDLDRSLRFYEEALGLKEVRRRCAVSGARNASSNFR